MPDGTDGFFTQITLEGQSDQKSDQREEGKCRPPTRPKRRTCRGGKGRGEGVNRRINGARKRGQESLTDTRQVHHPPDWASFLPGAWL